MKCSRRTPGSTVLWEINSAGELEEVCLLCPPFLFLPSVTWALCGASSRTSAWLAPFQTMRSESVRGEKQCAWERERKRKIKGDRAHTCVYMHTYLCMRVDVGIWGFAAVGALLLMAAHCSLSVFLSACLWAFPFYLSFFFSQSMPRLNLCPWTQAFLRV